MRVLVDTTVWSLALRRRATDLRARDVETVREWAELVREGRVLLPGIVRQEVLSGVAQPSAYQALRRALRAFPDEPVATADHEDAADCFNLCRSRGIAGSTVDMLICALARRRGAAVFTTDRDFDRYRAPLGLHLHTPRG